jgi:C4-dicarboxylate-specific signal transduction histidine kinase
MLARYSVKTRLLASFLVMMFFLIASIVLSFYSSDFFKNTLDKITMERLPPMILSQQLAARIERIVASAPVLISSLDEKEREAISSKINAEIEKLTQLVSELKQFSSSGGTVNLIESDFKTFIKYIEEIDQLVKKKHVLLLQEQQRYSEFLKIFNELQEIINPAISVVRSPIDALIYSYSNNTSGGKPRTVFHPTGIPEIIESLMSLNELRIQIYMLTNMLLSVPTEQNAEKLNFMDLKARSYLADIKEQIDHVTPELATLFTRLIKQFQDYTVGTQSFTDTRRQELNLLSDAQRLSIESMKLSLKLNTTVQELIHITQLDVNQATQKAKDTQKVVSGILIVVAAASLIFSALMGWLYVGRRVIRPIEELARAARAIEAGDLDRQVAIQGHDEIGNLAQAFNSMLKKRKAAEISLQQANDELEQRVRDRTAELLMRNQQLNLEIQERKRVEEELLHLNETLEQRVAQEVEKNMEQERMLIRQSRLAAMGEMIGNIAHQWRQPLNALGLLLYNIKDAYQFNTLDAAYLDQAVADGRRMVQKMSTTISDFSNFFRPDREIIVFSAMKQIRDAIVLVESSFLHSNISIHIDAPHDLNLLGFPNEYSQVLLNLLSNAKEAVLARNQPLSGRVDIFLMNQDGKGCVSVCDNGGGIPEDIIDRIFEPYFSTKEKGSGIGLYMSKMIIERNMNGSITAKNIGGGAEFSVCAPLAKDGSLDPS